MWNTIMKHMRHAIVLTTIITSSVVPPVPAVARHVTTTGELVELCSVRTDDPSYFAASVSAWATSMRRWIITQPSPLARIQ
jgi:hypothetical protein